MRTGRGVRLIRLRTPFCFVNDTRRFAAQGGPLTYKLTNLNIRTLASFTGMLQNMDSSTGLMLDRIFPRHHYKR